MLYFVKVSKGLTGGGTTGIVVESLSVEWFLVLTLFRSSKFNASLSSFD